MTFILTAVCVNPREKPSIDPPGLIFEPVAEDEHSWARAGYVPGLTRYFGTPVQGTAYHILVDDDGYQSSNKFLQYGEGDDDPAKLVVPDQYRHTFENLIRDLIMASAEGRVILVVEENGHVTAPDLNSDEADSIDCLGPVDLREFWRLLDLGDILEDSIVVIEN